MKRTEDVKVTTHTGDSERSLKAELEIAAPVEAVWKALTDGDELANWFPFEAKVEPGLGGSVWLSWGGDGEACKITAWEPNHHLGTGWPGAHAADPAKPIAVDYHLQGKAGGTTLRLVHTGFSADAEWDDEFDAHRRGWSFELRSLQHYLHHHRGTKRHMVKAGTPLTVPVEEAWSRILGDRGLAQEGSLNDLDEGDRFVVTTVTGDRLEGEVRVVFEPTDLAMTVENLDFSLLRLAIEHCSGGPTQIQLWLAAYGIPEIERLALETRWQGMLGSLFPAQ